MELKPIVAHTRPYRMIDIPITIYLRYALKRCFWKMGRDSVLAFRGKLVPPLGCQDREELGLG
jgi:hypothetical protein